MYVDMSIGSTGNSNDYPELAQNNQNKPKIARISQDSVSPPTGVPCLSFSTFYHLIPSWVSVVKRTQLSQ